MTNSWNFIKGAGLAMLFAAPSTVVMAQNNTCTWTSPAEHVDYWNYIGWEDPYSKKQFTERQYAHKRTGNISQIYTPQYVFSNREVRWWGQAGLIPQQLAAMKQDKAPVSIQISLERKAASQVEIKVKANWLDERYKAGRMFLALYEDNLSQQIKSGENRGELLRHNRVVRHFSQAVAVTPGGNAHVFEH